MNKTIWFYRRHTTQVRLIWAGIYGAKTVRRAQWMRALVIAVETIDAIAPMVQDEQTLQHIKNQLETLEIQVSSWRRE